jgi:hypothetical protein
MKKPYPYNMKKLITSIFIILCCALYPAGKILAQDEVAIVTPTTEAGENLDLMAILEIFSGAENLEDFEKKINEESSEVNNIDLNGDGEVDYLRVVEYAEENTRVIVIQAVIGEDQYQDVASIVLEKDDDGDISLQAIGDEEIYGEEYIVEPADETEIQTIVVVNVVYSPGYQPYVSPYRWGVYPAWYRTIKVVVKTTYHSRMRRYSKAKYRQTKARRSTRGKAMYAKNHKRSPRANPGPSTQKKKNQAQKNQVKKNNQPSQAKNKQQPGKQQPGKQQPGKQQPGKQQSGKQQSSPKKKR